MTIQECVLSGRKQLRQGCGAVIRAEALQLQLIAVVGLRPTGKRWST